MGVNSAAEADAWLRDGGVVVASSERAARSLTVAFHHARRAEGLAAWPAPQILDWPSFVRREWESRLLDGRLVLNSQQEQALWAEAVAAERPLAAQLAGSRQRLAALAMDAHRLLCAYAPQLLDAHARRNWAQDAAAFNAWLAEFDQLCHKENAVSMARLPLELATELEADNAHRPPLLLAGFDRILPTQRKLFAAWGKTQEAQPGPAAARIAFYAAGDAAAEITACALWCKQQLAGNPHARLLVITQEARRRRGEIERAFLRYAGANRAENLVEFSLGLPLAQVALVRGALLLLRWLAGHIEEHQIDWLFSTGLTAASPEESRALTAFMLMLRHRNQQRTDWALDEFLAQNPGAGLPAAWVARMRQTQKFQQEIARRPQSPLAWAEFVPRLLELAGWPGARPLVSAEFQALRSWQQAVDNCASLGFDGRNLEWNAFLDSLAGAAAETLFAPESQDAPILIAGPAESAGIDADAIWFLGASEESWPAPGTTHPLLPLDVQREAAMPHATPQLDWELAEATTRRLLASAPEICFSYARQNDGVDARPARLIAQLAGEPRPLPAELRPQPAPAPLTISISDAGLIPFPAGNAAGGSGVLTAQSQCPFKAFASARLGVKKWEPAEAGLTASERGQLLHEALHSIWSGPPDGIRTHDELIAIADLPDFVSRHVRGVLRQRMPARARESMPQKYLELEQTRLTGLIVEWLRYESARQPFAVAATEEQAVASVAGLMLHLRLDRIDRLNDGSLLVVDYKSGNVSPTDWELPHPDDVQLPLYAEFALGASPEPVGGLVFAKIRAGENEFAGRVRDAKATLFPSLNGNSGLMRKKLTDDEMEAWRSCIEQLAHDFLAGRAEVAPRKAETCERCGLQALCRILEKPPLEEDDNEEAADA